jgi:hypothetical protein
MAVIVFIYVIFRTLTDGVVVSGNYWHSPQLFDTSLDNSTETSLEWTQNSPPTMHTYMDLPYVVEIRNSSSSTATLKA